MVTWNSTAPLGSVSVRANRTILQDNTTYIETTMGNTAPDLAYSTAQQDHFWNVGSDYSGHHRFIKSPAYTVGGIPTDPGPALGTGMDTILYPKLIAGFDVQYFLRNVNTNIMQILGIRACVLFDGAGTILYAHNVGSVTRTGTGKFTVNYTAVLPTNKYLVLTGAIRNDSDATKELLCEVQGAVSINNVKSPSLVKVMTKSDGGNFSDPLQAWVMCFGG